MVTDDEWFTLVELSERLGALVWVERQLAEVCAQWSRIEPVPSAAILFATAGGHHAWHGEVVLSCLPTSPQLRATDAVRPPTNGWADAIAKLSDLTDADATAARVRSLVKVIDPWLERETSALLELGRPVSDAAITRWLRFVALDHEHDGGATRDVLATMAGDAVRVDDHVIVSELDLTR